MLSVSKTAHFLDTSKREETYLVFGQIMTKIVQSGKAIGGRGARLLESISGKILLLGFEPPTFWNTKLTLSWFLHGTPICILLYFAKDDYLSWKI